MSWNMQFLNFFLHAYDEVIVSDPLTWMMVLVKVVNDLIITTTTKQKKNSITILTPLEQ